MALEPLPAQKGSELVDQAAAIARSPQLDEVALHRIAADARRLMASNAVGAHMVLGIFGGYPGRCGIGAETLRDCAWSGSYRGDLVQLFDVLGGSGRRCLPVRPVCALFAEGCIEPELGANERDRRPRALGRGSGSGVSRWVRGRSGWPHGLGRSGPAGWLA